MYQEDKDDTTRVGLWITFGVVALVFKHGWFADALHVGSTGPVLSFMPIMLMGDIQRKAIQRDGIVHFYGHMRDSFERSINGLPMFHAVHMLDAADTERLNKWIERLNDVMTEEL